MQERLRLEVQRQIHVVLGSVDRPRLVTKDVLKDLTWPNVRDVTAYRCEHGGELVLLKHSLPVVVVLVHVLVEAGVDCGPVVPPRISAEQLVARGTREDDLRELAGELRRVEVGIALADAEI